MTMQRPIKELRARRVRELGDAAFASCQVFGCFDEAAADGSLLPPWTVETELFCLHCERFFKYGDAWASWEILPAEEFEGNAIPDRAGWCVYCALEGCDGSLMDFWTAEAGRSYMASTYPSA